MALLSIAFVLGLGAISAQAQSPLYGQCGGIGWAGATTCVSGSVCTYSNPYYSQCLPGTASSTKTTTTTTTSKPATTTTTATTSKPATTTTSSTISPSGTCTAIPKGTGKLKFAGVNISGFDFGCITDGSCDLTQTIAPLSQYSSVNGLGQMQHFVNNDGFNIFRLPAGWQFLTGNVETSTLNAANFAEYDTLVQACLSTGAYCIIDIHNYARYNGAIIGQGGPSNAVFAQLWSNIAAKYVSQSRVVFGIMNEPHDIPDINLWAASVQAAVTAIRQTGATSQMILLPGNDYTSAETFVSDGSAAALLNVVNLDGSTTNLIFDVHKYLDSDNSGTHADCVTNNIQEAWEPLSQWLRCNKRLALNTETGGGNTASCVQYLCEQIAYQAQNSDVILGYIGWAAGGFLPSWDYILTEVPTQSGSTWTDTLLVQSCVAPVSGSQSGPTS